MKNWLLIACMSAVIAGGVVIAHSQDPQFNTQGLEPFLGTQTKQATIENEPANVLPAQNSDPEITWTSGETGVDTQDVITIAPSVDIAVVKDDALAKKKVSVKFENAKASDVTKWLVRQGFNLVIPENAKVADKRITLSLKDVPGNEALDAIADALGGRWEQRGSVRVFRTGPSYRFGVAAPGVPALPNSLRVMPPIPPMASEKMSEADRKKWEAFGMEMAEMGTKLSEEIVKSFGDGMVKLEIDEKKMKEFADKMAKEAPRYEELAKSFEWSAKDKAEFEKQMKAFGERMAAEAPKWEKLGKAYEMDPKQRAEFEKQMKAFADQMAKDAPKWEKLGKDIEARVKVLTEEDMKRLGELKELRVAVPGKGSDLAALAKELTPAQRELHKKQGFLKFSDLTEAQRRHLGSVKTEGSWMITYSKDGESLTIRSDKFEGDVRIAPKGASRGLTRSVIKA